VRGCRGALLFPGPRAGRPLPCLRLSVGAAGSAHKPLAWGSGSALGAATDVFRPVVQRRSRASSVNEPPSRRAEGKVQINSVNLTARLTRDPDVVEFDPETAVCNLRVAIARRADGAVFVDVKTFGPQATACSDYLSNGDPVALTGRLELAEWQAKDGSKRSRLYVIAERLEFLARLSRSQPQARQAG
jgi:single-strand DNA-binding protein